MYFFDFINMKVYIFSLIGITFYFLYVNYIKEEFKKTPRELSKNGLTPIQLMNLDREKRIINRNFKLEMACIVFIPVIFFGILSELNIRIPEVGLFIIMTIFCILGPCIITWRMIENRKKAIRVYEQSNL